MEKECDVHGRFVSMVEPSWAHVSNFYRNGSVGRNNSIIIHVNESCNMHCPWCYYKPGMEPTHDLQFYNQLLWEQYGSRGFALMLSGGEPTLRPDYLEFVKEAYRCGWNPSTITNMISLADDGFFNQTINPAWLGRDGNYKFAMSFQHPDNYSAAILELKMKALENLRKLQGARAACVMFSIQNLGELDFIKEFYDDHRHLFSMLRIRTMFHAWGNKGEKQLYLSDLHAAFLEKFSDYTPIQCDRIERSNIYGMYLQTHEMRDISLMSAPTVHGIDYHQCSRPVLMFAPDLRCYPVPIAQCIYEGMAAGWKDGYKIREGITCL